MSYLVMQVGCIECGVSSYPIKVCATKEEAEAIEAGHPSTWTTEGGGGYVLIIDLDNVDEEFAEARKSWSDYTPVPDSGTAKEKDNE